MADKDTGKKAGGKKDRAPAAAAEGGTAREPGPPLEESNTQARAGVEAGLSAAEPRQRPAPSARALVQKLSSYLDAVTSGLVTPTLQAAAPHLSESIGQLIEAMKYAASERAEKHLAPAPPVIRRALSKLLDSWEELLPEICSVAIEDLTRLEPRFQEVVSERLDAFTQALEQGDPYLFGAALGFTPAVAGEPEENAETAAAADPFVSYVAKRKGSPAAGMVRPAVIITRHGDGSADLFVMWGGGDVPHESPGETLRVPYSAEGLPGTWHPRAASERTTLEFTPLKATMPEELTPLVLGHSERA
jgi:hypothetical protein